MSNFELSVTGYINPEILVNKIKMGQNIIGLKDSLTQMLCDLRLQVSIQDGCHDILVQDYFNLHEKLTRSQQRAISISNENTCGSCRREIVVKGKAIIKKLGEKLFFVHSLQMQRHPSHIVYISY